MAALVRGLGRGHPIVTGRIAVAVETGTKRVFARALDWPGWSRSGRTEEAALEALAGAAARYAVVATTAGEPGPGAAGVDDFRDRGARPRRRRHRLRRPEPGDRARSPAGVRAPRPIASAGWSTRRGPSSMPSPRPRRRSFARARAAAVATGPDRRPRPWRRPRLLRGDGDPRAGRRRRDDPSIGRRHALGGARAPRPPVRRHAAQRSEVAASLRRRAGSPGTPSTMPGRSRTGRVSLIGPRTADDVTGADRRAGPPSSPTAAAASPMTSSGRRPAARSSRTPVSPSDFDSLAPLGLRMSGWWANAGGSAGPGVRPSRICAGVASARSSPRTTSEIDCRRSSTTTHRAYVQLPWRSRIGESPANATSPDRRPEDPVDPRSPHRRRARAEASARAPRRGPVRGIAPGSRRPPSIAVRAAAQFAERRSRAVASVDQSGRCEAGSAASIYGAWSVTLPDRPGIGHEPEPVEVLEHARSRTPRGFARGRGPRSAAAPARLPRPPGPRRRWRWRRGRGGGIRSVPERSASRRVSNRGCVHWRRCQAHWTVNRLVLGH